MQTLPSCIFFLLIASAALAQDTSDTAFVAAAKQYAVALHDKELQSQSVLYNGRKYIAPEYEPESHPYFSLDDWITGTVSYDEETFTGVSLMYDLYKDALVTEHFPSGHPIQLVPEKIRYFIIDGHKFEKIYTDSVGGSLPSTAFYDVLYSGKTRVVARRQKIRREEIRDMSINTFFEEKNRYYVLKNGVFFPLKNKGSIMKVLADKKRALKKFIKDANVSTRDKEQVFIRIAQYYDSLE